MKKIITAVLATGLMLGMASVHAEDTMSKDGMKKDEMGHMSKDGMKKNKMAHKSKDGMKKDEMQKDEMSH